MRRVCALLLFVLGESVLASLSFGVAALPALLSFLAGSALMARGTWP
jgi:hypothetical protein